VSLKYEEVQVHNFITCVRRHWSLATGRDLPLDVVSVLANRIDFRRPQQPLGPALAILESVAAEAAQASPEARNEIGHVARMQVANILLQCVLKGITPLRIAAARRLLGNPSLWLGRSGRALLDQMRVRYARGRGGPAAARLRAGS
jgi:hypothetical protein